MRRCGRILPSTNVLLTDGLIDLCLTANVECCVQFSATAKRLAIEGVGAGVGEVNF